MVVSWRDLQQWNPAELVSIASRVRATSAELATHALASSELVVQLDWHGPAADAARSSVLTLRGDLLDRVRSLEAIGRCVAEAAARMYPVVHSAVVCENDAEESSLMVQPDGTVVDTLAVYAVSAADAWSVGRDRLRVRREIQARVDELIREASDLDQQTAARLATCEVDSAVSALHASTVPAASGIGRAASNSAFWESATQADRTTLLVREPEKIGNLDGIPAAVRDAANRRMLTLERTRLAVTAEDLRNHLNNNVFGGLLDNADAGLEQTEKRLAALDAIADTLAKGNRQLLVLDNSSTEDTLAAIAIGNVDTATHVAVFVPGLDSDVRGDIGRYDTDMQALADIAEQSVPPNESVACVTWMDYRAPHTGWSLLDPNRSVAGATAAVVGAARLRTFLDGIDASRRTDPHLSLLGHSYGSLTAAHALRDAAGTGVDDMVVVGSPGLGVGTVHELSVPPGHLFVGEAANDIVADLGAFGADPSSLDGVRTLPTGASGVLQGSHGHSEYLTDGTTSQHAVAMVVVGRGGDVS